MTKESFSSAQHRHVVQVLTGAAKYCGKDSDVYMESTSWFMDVHPITGDQIGSEDLEYVGTPDCSISTGAWQRTVLDRYGDHLGDLHPLRFHVYQLPVNPGADKHQLFVEAQLGYPNDPTGENVVHRIMCGGMTDHSGEGGKAWNLVQLFIGGFVATYGCLVHYNIMQNLTTADTIAAIQSRIDEQREA